MKERIPVKGREHPAECHLETENAQERRKGTQGAEDAAREGKGTPENGGKEDGEGRQE